MKQTVAILLTLMILIGNASALYDYPDKEYGKGYVKHYDPAEQKAIELCQDLETQRERYEAITRWLNSNISYDYLRQDRWRTLPGPDIKQCFDKRTGICMDISALACCMFRAVGIRADVVFGWATWIYTMRTDVDGVRVYHRGTSWHAWCEVIVDGEMVLYDQDIERRNVGKTRLIYTAEHIPSHVIK